MAKVFKVRMKSNLGCNCKGIELQIVTTASTPQPSEVMAALEAQGFNHPSSKYLTFGDFEVIG